MLIYRDFEGNLPFTGIIWEVYGLPYATSTHNLMFGLTKCGSIAAQP